MSLSPSQPHRGARVAALFACVALAGAAIAFSPTEAFAADTQAPTVPTAVIATTSTVSPVIATVTWTASTDDVGVTGYYVWRSMTATATPVRIDEVTASPFTDETGVPGQTYYYSVSAFDAVRNESARSVPLAGPIVAGWTQVPHATYTSAGRYCRVCHAPHQAATQAGLMRQTSRTPGELSVCYACHDGQGASTNIMSGPTNSFALTSGHVVEGATSGADLTNLCSSCHNAHVDYTKGGAKLPRAEINSTAVDGPDNSWCFACHNDTNDWYGAGYPVASSPSRDASGYPVVGTFPGRTVYADPAKNAHASIPASGTIRQSGDCLYCHNSHQADNKYDGLIKNFVPSTPSSVSDDQANGTYAASCFDCHAGTDELRSEFTTAPVDIKQFVTAGTERAGHRIKTPDGNLPVGAPVPCYDCHNPHGSTRGNGALLADTLGRSLNTDTAADVRHVCFSCHSSGDGKVWDSSLATPAYVNVGTQTVEGLRRDGGDGSVLSIPAGVTGHTSTDTQSCYQCHGSDYGTGGYNVHNPTGGVSPGGVDCYACHATYESYMESGGTNSTTVYHHVMGTGTVAGDTAFANGFYPSSPATDVYCMSCHADHDQFNDSQSGNLRLSLSATATTSTTDYISTGAYGICVSCHSTSLAKDNTNQKPEAGSTATPKIVGGTGAGGFGTPDDVVAHNYTASSTFGDTTTFDANCSKCHNDEQTKDFQLASGNQFGTHYSAARRLLSALGGTVTDPLAEAHCYRCHSETGDVAAGKSANGSDWYGAKSMTAASEDVYDQFQLASKHPVAATASGSVECESCHNVHVVRNTAGSFVSDPLNTYNLSSYSTTQQQADYCLNCHDANGGPTRQVDDTSYVPYDVSLTAAGMDKMTYGETAARGHWKVNGAISATETKSCAVCHDNHGSVAPKLLGARDVTTNLNRIFNSATASYTSITANNNTVCLACHTNASTGNATGFTRLANGYPNTGPWPGNSVYTNTTNGIHRAITGGVTQWDITIPSYSTAGDCKVCHDVHGTTNLYDGLRGRAAGTLPNPYSFATAEFFLCLTCHDATGPSTRNIAQYYWSATGGSVAGTPDRASHSGDAVRATPCYDCHNPHGSATPDGLLVVSQITSTDTRVFGDAAGEFNLSTAQGMRDFCFSCHLPNNTNNEGYSGTANTPVTVDANATIDGYNRRTQLKITQGGQAHTNYSRNQSCISAPGCHDFVHAPS